MTASFRRIDSFFGRSKTDALLLTSRETPDPNFLYMSGLELDSTVLVARKDGSKRLLVSTINEREAATSGFDVVVWRKQSDFWKSLRDSLRGCRSVSLDYRSLSARTYANLKARLGSKRLTDCSRRLLEQRSIKSPQELSLIRKSTGIAREIVGGLDVSLGKRELEVSAELKKAALEKSVGLSFQPIVLSGSRTSMPHGKPSLKRVRSDEVVLVDFGVSYKGYCSDISRCFFTGPCREQRERYASLEAVFREVSRRLTPGTKCSSVANLCDGLMKREGLGQMIHAPGHGIGLQVHELPALGPNSKGTLASGMTVAIEPAFYCSGYGLRYEEDLVIRNKRASLL